MLDRGFLDLHLALLEEAREVADAYELYLDEYVIITEARRDTCLVPQGPGWVSILRQGNSINRRIERGLVGALSGAKDSVGSIDDQDRNAPGHGEIRQEANKLQDPGGNSPFHAQFDERRS